MCSNNNMNFIFLYKVARILPFFVYVNKATCDKLPETLIRYCKKNNLKQQYVLSCFKTKILATTLFPSFHIITYNSVGVHILN